MHCEIYESAEEEAKIYHKTTHHLAQQYTLTHADGKLRQGVLTHPLQTSSNSTFKGL